MGMDPHLLRSAHRRYLEGKSRVASHMTAIGYSEAEILEAWDEARRQGLLSRMASGRIGNGGGENQGFRMPAPRFIRI